jgi:D-serine deaminase-like pyridoxal phosphate-dependent protein
LGREPLRGAGGADEGFGSLLEHPEVVVKAMSEEHGILDLRRTHWRPTVGERVRVIPNHVCIVVHLNDVVFGVRGNAVETSWQVNARGRGYAARGKEINQVVADARDEERELPVHSLGGAA